MFRAPWHDHLEEEGEDEVALMAVAGSKAVVAAALMEAAVVGVEEEEGEAETVIVIVGEGVVMEEGTTSADVAEVEGAVVVVVGTDTGRTDSSVNVDLLYLQTMLHQPLKGVKYRPHRLRSLGRRAKVQGQVRTRVKDKPQTAAHGANHNLSLKEACHSNSNKPGIPGSQAREWTHRSSTMASMLDMATDNLNKSDLGCRCSIQIHNTNNNSRTSHNNRHNSSSINSNSNNNLSSRISIPGSRRNGDGLDMALALLGGHREVGCHHTEEGLRMARVMLFGSLSCLQ
jgi:hypothetical protein